MSLADARAEKRSDFNLILRLPLWSGCRRSGARGMAWSELEDGRWTVPKGRTKNHRPLVLLLPRQALDALAGWPRFFGQDHLFGRGTDGFQGWSKAKARVGLEYDLHDLGCTVETRLAALGAPKEISSRVRNHATGPITEGYDHWSYGPEKAAALQRWADELERITSKPGGRGCRNMCLAQGRLGIWSWALYGGLISAPTLSEVVHIRSRPDRAIRSKRPGPACPRPQSDGKRQPWHASSRRNVLDKYSVGCVRGALQAIARSGSELIGSTSEKRAAGVASRSTPCFAGAAR